MAKATTAVDLNAPVFSNNNNPPTKVKKKKAGWGGARKPGVTLDGKPSKPQVRYKDGKPVKPSPLKGRKQTKYWSRAPKKKAAARKYKAGGLHPGNIPQAGMYLTRVTEHEFGVISVSFTPIPQ